MPSLRAVVVRPVFGGSVSLVRRWRERGTGPITGETPIEAFEEGALQVRAALELLTRGNRLAGGVSEEQARGTPVPSWWYLPSREDEGRVVLYLHGGAYIAGSHRTHRGLASAFARVSGARVLLPEYRLAPEHRFPAAVDDTVASYRWLVEQQRVDPACIVIAGDSAGGGLAVATALALKDEGLPQPAGLVCMSPWTDLTASGDSIVANDGDDIWLDGPLIAPAGRMYAVDQAEHPLASPLFGDLTGLPPMLVHVGGHEVLEDDARRLVTRARAAGVDASLGVFAGMWHVFQAIPGIPEGRQSLRECGGFVRRVTAQARALAFA